MDDSSSGFGEESPILFKHPKSFSQVRISEKNLNLDDLYNKVILHLKKQKILTRKELTTFLAQMDKIQPEDPKERWLAKKIKGLIKYILKKRADFQKAIVQGEIVVYEKCSEERPLSTTSVSHAPGIDYFENSLCSEREVNIASNLLTNNDFVSMNALEEQNVVKKELVRYNYSEDLFSSNAAEILHNYSQENYQFLKTLTQNSISNEISQLAPIDQVHKVHETLEENFTSLISQTTVKQDDNLIKCEEKNTNVTMEYLDNNEINFFHQFPEDSQQLKEIFRSELEKTEKWVTEIISNLMKMDLKKKRRVKKERTNNDSLNLSFTTISSTQLKPYYSEENYKIIKETCLHFKKKKGLPFLTTF